MEQEKQTICTQFVEAALTESPIDEPYFSGIRTVFSTLILGDHNVDYHAEGTLKDCRCSGFYTHGCPYFTSGGQLCAKFSCDYQQWNKIPHFGKVIDEIKDMNLDAEQVQFIAHRLNIGNYSPKEGGKKTECPHFYFF